MQKKFLIVMTALWLSACGSTPTAPAFIPAKPVESRGGLSLPDYTVFYQKDKRWENEMLGNSGDTLGTDGCLVTAAAMALGNLGFQTTPSDLNKRLTEEKSFTSRGWLIWDGIRKVTDNRAKAIYYDSVDATQINSCLTNGDYPLVQFYLPSGRSHWAMIVRKSQAGYHMRDPLRESTKPLIFPHKAEAFKALRCIGLS